MRHSSLTHEFVEYIPTELAEGVLYISSTYRTAVHRCACGCGNKVVTPITPADWQLFYDGDTVSLTPSIGNWGFPCGSHYWIDTGRVRWARAWTADEITAGRSHDNRGRVHYFAERAAAASAEPVPATPTDTRTISPRRWLPHLTRRFLGRDNRHYRGVDEPASEGEAR